MSHNRATIPAIHNHLSSLEHSLDVLATIVFMLKERRENSPQHDILIRAALSEIEAADLAFKSVARSATGTVAHG